MIKKRKDSLTLREGRARVVPCPRCKRDAGQPCVSGDLNLIRAHSERMEAYGVFVREAYCANEMLSGHPCSTPGCHFCGGMTAAELEAFGDYPILANSSGYDLQTLGTCNHTK